MDVGELIERRVNAEARLRQIDAMMPPVWSPPVKGLHKFTISHALERAVGRETIYWTARDMEKMGIYRLPFDKNVSVYITDMKLETGEVFDGDFGYHNLENDSGEVSCITHNPSRAFDIRGREMRGFYDWAGGWSEEDRIADRRDVRDMLVVLLATKGVERTTTVSKLSRLGIGKPRPASETVLSLSRSISEAEGANGLPVRPHLRRGHITHQPHGPRNSLRKQIWIEPCFVNQYDGEPIDPDAGKNYRIRP